MVKKLKGLLFLLTLVVSSVLVGCKAGEKKPTVTMEATNEVPTTEDATTEAPTTEAPTTEAPTTEVPTTEEPTTEEPTTAPFVSTFSLIQAEQLNPAKTGYQELDTLIDELFAKILTDDMGKYTKVWTCYEYLVDNITYSRGMDANTGAYSESSPETTPKEVLWATDLLNSGQGCCYNYSAAFAYIMKTLGYDARLISGNVPAYAGGVTPHCWVVVYLDGAPYTFDPDLDMNYFTRGDSETKDIWFGRKMEEVGYFYKAETDHGI